MKRIIILYMFLPVLAIAATPSTECPTGYVMVNKAGTTIATECPSGYIEVGTANSCLVSNPSYNCIMYAPVGMSFTDEIGTYEFTDVCAMK